MSLGTWLVQNLKAAKSNYVWNINNKLSRLRFDASYDK